MLREEEPVKLGALGAAAQNAFVILKQHLVKPPILALLWYGRMYTVDTDACVEQVGFVFSQATEDDEKVLHPIGY